MIYKFYPPFSIVQGAEWVIRLKGHTDCIEKQQICIKFWLGIVARDHLGD